MATYLENAVARIVQAAGWQKPAANAAGVYNFTLQGDLDFSLFSPDGGNNVILTSPVQSLPEDNRAQEALLQALAQRAVLAARTRRSTLALYEDKLIVQQRIQSKTIPLNDIPQIAESFLNDVAWWRAQAARLMR